MTRKEENSCLIRVSVLHVKQRELMHTYKSLTAYFLQHCLDDFQRSSVAKTTNITELTR